MNDFVAMILCFLNIVNSNYINAKYLNFGIKCGGFIDHQNGQFFVNYFNSKYYVVRVWLIC